MSRSDKRQQMIGVIGASVCDSKIGDIAYRAGREIALEKCVLVCGGMGGVMLEAARGAFENGGCTIGLLPGLDPSEANPFITIPLATGLDQARNAVLVRSCDGLIAIAGGYGTLSEIAFALKMNKPVVGVMTWDFKPGIDQFTDPVPALKSLMQKIR